MTTRARIETKQAYLSTNFGRSVAQLWLGMNNEIIEAIVGRYFRGKRKGQLRGMIYWKKVVSGGWVYSDNGQGGYVVYPGTISDVRIADSFTGETIYARREDACGA